MYNRNRDKAEGLLTYGISVAGSLAYLGRSADVIRSCLTDDDAVRNVYLGNDGILDEAHKNGLRVAAHLYHLDNARALVADGVDVIAHSIRDGEVDNALLSEMKNHHVAYIPTLSLDDFAFAYCDSPARISDPFSELLWIPGYLR